MQREKIFVQREKVQKNTQTIYRNKGHCKQTNKQSGENAKMGEIHTNISKEKRHHKHKGFDQPFKYPAESEKKNKSKMKMNCVYPARCDWRKCTVSEDHNCGGRL